jgi:hypothetical protein
MGILSSLPLNAYVGFFKGSIPVAFCQLIINFPELHHFSILKAKKHHQGHAHMFTTGFSASPWGHVCDRNVSVHLHLKINLNLLKSGLIHLAVFQCLTTELFLPVLSILVISLFNFKGFPKKILPVFQGNKPDIFGMVIYSGNGDFVSSQLLSDFYY